MKTQKNFSLALSLAMAMVLAAFVAGCGTYQVQGKFDVGSSIDQQAPTQVVDANGNVRVKPPQNATVDLVGLGDVRFGQRSMQGAGTLTTPANQVVVKEKRTVREETYQDTRGCPDKSQIREVKTGDVKKTEMYTRVEDHPAKTVGLNTHLTADDGPGTKLVGKGIDAGASFMSNGLYGLLRRPDNNTYSNTTTQSGGGATVGNVTSGSSSKTGPISLKQNQDQLSVNNNENNNENYNKLKNTDTTTIGITNKLKSSSASAAAAD